MDNFTHWIRDLSGLSPAVQNRILASLFLVLFLWLLRKIVTRIIWKRTDDIQIRYRWQKTTTYVMVTLGFLVVGRMWFEGIASLATFLGLIGAGLAIALQDLIKSFAGWIFIWWRRPFAVGDRVQIGSHAGDVIDIRVFKFSMLEIGNWVEADQSTGRVIHVPNSQVLDKTIANYGHGFRYIWNEIPVLVTFESDWEKAKDILRKVAGTHAESLSGTVEQRIKEASRRYMIFYQSLTPTVYTSVRDSGVLLTMRYLTDPRKRRGSEEAMWEGILREFSRCDDIDFAYPTQRFYRNPVEGKPGARAEIPAEPPPAPPAHPQI